MLHLDDQTRAFHLALRRDHHAERLDDRIGPRLEAREIHLGHANQLGDHDHRQRVRELLYEIELGTAFERIEQLGRRPIDQRTDLAHPLVGEERFKEIADLRVSRRVAGRAGGERQPTLGVLGDHAFGDAARLQRHRTHTAGVEIGLAHHFPAKIEGGHQPEAPVRHPIERGLRARRGIERVGALLDLRVHQVVVRERTVRGGPVVGHRPSTVNLSRTLPGMRPPKRYPEFTNTAPSATIAPALSMEPPWPLSPPTAS